MKITGVIFDMDGVIVLTEKAHWQSWLAAAKPRGVQLEYPEFVSCFGRINPDCIRILFGEVSTQESDAIAEEKESAFREIIRHDVPLAPGLTDLLQSLRAMTAKPIASNLTKVIPTHQSAARRAS